MSVKVRSRILLIAVLAALLLSTPYTLSGLSAALSNFTVDGLYDGLHWALWLVIVGVIVEEWKLLLGILRFAQYTWSGRFREATRKALKHTGEIVEGVGFTVLVLGLAGELLIDPVIEARHRDMEIKAASDLEKQRTLTAQANNAAAQASLLLARVGAWRTLSPDQQNNIAHARRRLPKLVFDVAQVGNDLEADHFLPFVEDALIKGGWTERDWDLPSAEFMDRSSSSRPKAGVFTAYAVVFFIGDNFSVTESDRPKVLAAVNAAAVALLSANIAAGVAPKPIWFPRDRQNMLPPRDSFSTIIHVVVGTRPPIWPPLH